MINQETSQVELADPNSELPKPDQEITPTLSREDLLYDIFQLKEEIKFIRGQFAKSEESKKLMDYVLARLRELESGKGEYDKLGKNDKQTGLKSLIDMSLKESTSPEKRAPLFRRVLARFQGKRT